MKARGWARAAAVRTHFRSLALVAVLLAIGGCGSGSVGEGSSSARSSLLSGRHGMLLGPAQLGRVRRAASAFAHSYAASIQGGAGVVVRDATPALARELRLAAARVSPAARRERPRVLALALDPLSVLRVRASATVQVGGGAPFPIVFVLGRSGERWLAAGLPGDPAG